MSTRKPSVSAVTNSRSFGAVVDGRSVFSVQRGVSTVEALEYALCLLGAAGAQIKAAADDARDADVENSTWATYFLIESVEALLSASVSGMREMER